MDTQPVLKMMKAGVACFVFACLMISICHAEDTSSATPPGFYIDTGKPCPFECCSYGEWTVDAPVTGYKEPHLLSEITGQFQEGNIATVSKGEMHSFAGEFLVKKVTRTDPRLRNLPGYGTDSSYSEIIRPGDTLYLYSYLGEGYYKIWFKGNFYVDSLVADGIEGEITKKAESTWWVYATSPLGWSGWSNEPARFGNNNSCPDASPWNIRVLIRTANRKIRSKQQVSAFNNLLNQLNKLSTSEIMTSGYSLYPNGEMYVDLRVVLKPEHSTDNLEQSIADLRRQVQRIASELGLLDSLEIITSSY